MENKETLHGNKTKTDPEKDVVPRFTNYVVNNYSPHETGHGKIYYNTRDDDAEFCKDEVNQNKK